MKRMVDKVQEKAAKQRGDSRPASPVNEGQTIIDKKPSQTNKSNDSVGEYVDFEEID